MTAQAAPRVPKDSAGKNPDKKSTGRQTGRKKTALDAMAEYSLNGFLENEPDLYSVADVKVRYR